MNSKIIKFLAVSLYLVIFLLKYQWLSWVFFAGGFIFGILFHYFDFLLYPFYGNQDQEIVKLAHQYLGQKNLKHYLQILLLNQSHLVGLMTRSLLFVSIFLPLAVFILSTSQYAFGKALVLGLGLNLSFDLVQFRNQPKVFNQVFRGQFDFQLTSLQINQLVIAFVSIFSLLSILSLI